MAIRPNATTFLAIFAGFLVFLIFVYPTKFEIYKNSVPSFNDASDSEPVMVPMYTASKSDFEARAKIVGDTCESIWKNWENTGDTPLYKKPPGKIPSELYDKYTLFGKIPVKKWYFNEMATPHKRIWSDIDAQMAMTKSQILSRSTYGKHTDVLYDAMTKYEEFVRNKAGAVVGSQLPWCEVYALKHGAASVLTIEYQQLDIRTKYPVSYIHPFTLAANWTKFSQKLDFIVSFSSLEHSGLGRYGDPLDPFGDLREMAKMRCLLKENGVMFIGFPVGKDALVWNAHRVYGPIRLPWMFLGLKLLGVMWHTENGVQFTQGIPVQKINSPDLFEFEQPAIVLQRIEL